MHKGLLGLARGSGAVRRHLYACVAAAVAAGLLVLVQAELLAGVLSGRFAVTALTPFVLVIAARGALTWIQGLAAARTAAAVKTTLRRRLLAQGHSGERSGAFVTLIGRGLDALDP